jgi:hypothetical protein
VTQPVSVYNAVLPGSYQFAVVTPDGAVVFHSDPTRNLRENFLAESDVDSGLRSRVLMRVEGAVTANYLGRPHRMYVLPMKAANQDGPLTIVIFRDLHMEEVMNLEILSLVSILFIIYAAALTLVMLVARWATKSTNTTAWFWPDSCKSGTYRLLAIVNIVSAGLLVILSRWVPGIAFLVCVLLIPAGAFLLSRLSLRHKHDAEVQQNEADQPDAKECWRSAYYLAAASLVLVIAVVPCLCFFRVAAMFEHRVLTVHTLLQLDSDLESREQAWKEVYEDVQLGNFEDNVLTSPDSQKSAGLDKDLFPKSAESPVYSYHETLEVHFRNGSGLSNTRPSFEGTFLSFISWPYNERAWDDRNLAEGESGAGRWSSITENGEHVIELAQRQARRIIRVTWHPFYLPWIDWVWWLGIAVLLVTVYCLVRVSVNRIFLMNLAAPAPARELPGLNPASLMADLPMNLLLIGHETSRPISALLHRSDVQVHEATELQEAVVPPDKLTGEAGFAKPAGNAIDRMISDGRPLVLRNFERLSDDSAAAAVAHAAINRLVSALDNSVILVSSMDPILVPSIETSECWRNLLRSFVRIDLSTTPSQRVDEDDAQYQGRISAESYFHWLFAGLPKLDKLVMLQLAKEKVVNPSSGEIVEELMEQGMIERRWGLLTVKDNNFAKFLHHALPHHTIKHWEKQIAGERPFSLQTSLLIIGVGIVAFLLYTQGDVFNTWVTYASGVAAAVPKVLQLLENIRGKTGATS